MRWWSRRVASVSYSVHLHETAAVCVFTVMSPFLFLLLAGRCVPQRERTSTCVYVCMCYSRRPCVRFLTRMFATFLCDRCSCLPCRTRCSNDDTEGDAGFLLLSFSIEHGAPTDTHSFSLRKINSNSNSEKSPIPFVSERRSYSVIPRPTTHKLSTGLNRSQCACVRE